MDGLIRRNVAGLKNMAEFMSCNGELSSSRHVDVQSDASVFKSDSTQDCSVGSFSMPEELDS